MRQMNEIRQKLNVSQPHILRLRELVVAASAAAAAGGAWMDCPTTTYTWRGERETMSICTRKLYQTRLYGRCKHTRRIPIGNSMHYTYSNPEAIP